jgi:hypothetical protein
VEAQMVDSVRREDEAGVCVEVVWVQAYICPAA